MRPHRRGLTEFTIICALIGKKHYIAYANICALIGEDQHNIQTYAPSLERIVRMYTNICILMGEIFTTYATS